MPILGVIFLRHAANRFEAATRQIEDEQAGARMPKRKVGPARPVWHPSIGTDNW